MFISYVIFSVFFLVYLPQLMVNKDVYKFEVLQTNRAKVMA